jgi:hypothetical protein
MGGGGRQITLPQTGNLLLLLAVAFAEEYPEMKCVASTLAGIYYMQVRTRWSNVSCCSLY